jgi:hypothetical protein
MTRHFTSIFGGLPSQLKGLGGLKLFALAVFMLALASHLPQYTGIPSAPLPSSIARNPRFSRVSIMEQSADSMPPKLDEGYKTMPLPEEVQRRLSARAVTDPDLASLLAIFTKPDETVSEIRLDQVTGDAKTPRSEGSQLI